jgi:hypothetical protein
LADKTKEEVNVPVTNACLILFVASITLVSGCSGEKSPVTPESPSRTISSFVDSQTLFYNQSFDYDEVDLGALVEVNQFYPGSSATIDGLHGCIAITVEHDANEDRILYAWLNEDDEGFIEDGTPAAFGVFYSGNSDEPYKPDYEIRSARVAASYRPSSSIIEVAVVFMYRDRNPTPTHTWGIGIVRGVWTLNDFPDQPTIIPEDFFIVDPEVPWGCWSPDVAYNYTNGDIHVVWTKWVDDIDVDQARLAYRRYIKSQDHWIRTYVITEENPVQQWIPRIAVGDVGFEAPHDQLVAVAYTRKQSNPPGDPIPWHVGCAYWSAFANNSSGNQPPDSAVLFALPYDTTYEAGLPQIAVTQGNCQEKYGTVVFTQYTGTEYHAVEINSKRGGDEYLDHFWEIEGEDSTYCILPSVTCHYVTLGNGLASISFFEATETAGEWQVTYGRFDPEASSPAPEWQYMVGDGGTVYGYLSSLDYADYLRIHTFQGSEIVAADIGDDWHQAYWIGWCNAIDSYASTVYASFGDTL